MSSLNGLTYGISEEEARRCINNVKIAASSLHILMSRAIVDVETIKDSLIHFGRYRNVMKHDYETAIKAVERCLRYLDEDTLDDGERKSLMENYQIFSDAIDWFFDKRVYTCGETADRDIMYRARFSPHPPTYTKEEYAAYEKGFFNGAVDGKGEKLEIHFKDTEGNDWVVDSESAVDYILKVINRDGAFPKELNARKSRKTRDNISMP